MSHVALLSGHESCQTSNLKDISRVTHLIQMLIHVCVLVRRLCNKSCHISDSIASDLEDMGHVTHLIQMLHVCVFLSADSAMSHVTHLTLFQRTYVMSQI